MHKCRSASLNMLQTMILLRIIFVYFFIFFMLLWILCFCCFYSGRGASNVSGMFKERTIRLPVISTYLMSRARIYDPNNHTGDVEVKECICSTYHMGIKPSSESAPYVSKNSKSRINVIWLNLIVVTSIFFT